MSSFDKHDNYLPIISLCSILEKLKQLLKNILRDFFITDFFHAFVDINVFSQYDKIPYETEKNIYIIFVKVVIITITVIIIINTETCI